MTNVARNAPIRDWQSGQVVEGFALVTRKETRQDRNGRTYLDLELADATARVPAKVWAASPALEADFEAHQFVAFKGNVKLYREQLQISIDECRVATDEDRRYGFDEASLIPSTKEDIDALWQRLEEICSKEVDDPQLRRLARQALDTYGERLRTHPAAKVMHHAYRGGLLEHVVSMAELVILISSHYRDLDRNLMLLGVVFHDLGKILELGAMPANDYTLEGRLVGHVVMGRDMVRECAAAIEGLPKEQLLHLEHLVLSHQGRKEYASPVEPMTPEALALHFIDDLDSKINQFRGLREHQTGMAFLRGLGRWVYLAPENETAAAEPREEGEAEGEPSREASPRRTLFD